MLLGFKRRFAPFILDGSKTHTIRGIRKHPPRPGEICHCYVNPRQKEMALLGRWPCVKVEDIRIEAGHDLLAREWLGAIWINGNRLEHDEMNLLAWRDGFRYDGTVMEICDPPVSRECGCFNLMMEFWRGRLPFEGHLIHWDYGTPVSANPSASPRTRCS